MSRTARAQHICAICNKQFKNNYNLRRHQSVHTGVRMKDRAREQAEGAEKGAAGQVGVVAVAALPVLAVGAGGRAERPAVPLSLLHLSAPPPLAPPGVLAGAQQTPLGGRDGEGIAMANVMASVNPHAPPPAAVVMATGATVQVGQGLVETAVVKPKPSSTLFLKLPPPQIPSSLADFDSLCHSLASPQTDPFRDQTPSVPGFGAGPQFKKHCARSPSPPTRSPACSL